MSTNRKLRELLLLTAALSGPAFPTWAGTCTVDATVTNQYIHCIGASSAWSAVGSLGTQLFAVDNVNGDIGISSLRTRIDPTDTGSGSAWNSELNNVNSAKAVNPNVLFWSTAWTPPAAYKSNNNVNGYVVNGGVTTNGGFTGSNGGAPNSADTGYAQYLTRYLQYVKSYTGVNLYSISPQNESNFEPSYEGCTWTSGNFASFVPCFAASITSAGLSTKIMIPEPDNEYGMNLASQVMNNASSAALVGILCTHLYGENPLPLSSFGFTNVTNQEWWETEMSGGTNTDMSGGLMVAGWAHGSLVEGQMNSFHYWWLADLIVNNALDTKAFVLGNYSKFIRPGYYRMGATEVPSSGVSVSAYKNTNNSSPQTIVIVAINGNNSTVNQTFSLNGLNVTSVTPWLTNTNTNLVQQAAVPVSGNSFTYSMPVSSVVSFVGVNNGGTPVPTATPTRTPTPVVQSTWRVNAGGPAYTDSMGNTWVADVNYSGGSTVASGGTITGTNDSTLYDTQRYGSSFSYSFSVPAGNYQVTLKFAETY
ncbi:MAG TPA: malectin domain-containing carbohydrate-binding protein, partial [bacterium]|nr:malectin domain-containing carbohydrate-binding protein [bacterium]